LLFIFEITFKHLIVKYYIIVAIVIWRDRDRDGGIAAAAAGK
jgi:hypothetical protein